MTTMEKRLGYINSLLRDEIKELRLALSKIASGEYDVWECEEIAQKALEESE